MFSRPVQSSFESKIPVSVVKRTGDSSSGHSRVPAAQSTARNRSDDEEVSSFEYVGGAPSGNPIPTYSEKTDTFVEEREQKIFNMSLTNPVKLGLASRSSNAGKGSDLPPERSTTIEVPSRVFRFRSSAGGSNNVTTSTLFGACGAMGITSTTVQYLASSVKLHSLKIWLPSTTTSTSLVYWGYSTAAGFMKDESKSRTLPDGITVSGCQTFVPPRDSLLGTWLSSTLSGSNTVCTIACPAGAIIDINVSFTIQNLNATFSALTVASAVVGRVYYLPLDGVSSNHLQAQGVSTTS